MGEAVGTRSLMALLEWPTVKVMKPGVEEAGTEDIMVWYECVMELCSGDIRGIK
jgi:hypothetical protein